MTRPTYLMRPATRDLILSRFADAAPDFGARGGFTYQWHGLRLTVPIGERDVQIDIVDLDEVIQQLGLPVSYVRIDRLVHDAREKWERRPWENALLPGQARPNLSEYYGSDGGRAHPTGD